MILASKLSSSLSRAGKLAGLAMITWGVLGLWAWSRYEARGTWYADYGASRPILIAVGVSSLACFFAVAARLRTAHERRPAAYLIPAGVMVTAIATDAWTARRADELARIAEDTRGLDARFTDQCETRATLASAERCADDQRWACVERALATLEGLELEPQLDSVHDELVERAAAAGDDDAAGAASG